MSAPSSWGWRRRVADQLARLGVLGPVVAAYESLAGLRWSLRRGGRALGGELPIPPARLRVRAGPAHGDVRYFVESGMRHAALIRETLEARGSPLGPGMALLDFGCGCGRVVRHLLDADGVDVVGCDINPKAIAWCTRNLQRGSFTVSRLEPPLPFSAGRFDLVYAFSVFTHLPESLQLAWIDEFERIVRPGGILLVSTLGDHYIGLGRLTDGELASYRSGELVVLYEGDAGSNLCSAYHPPSYVERTWTNGFEHVALLTAADDARHDIHVLRRVA